MFLCRIVYTDFRVTTLSAIRLIEATGQPRLVVIIGLMLLKLALILFFLKPQTVGEEAIAEGRE
jgi:1-acyl-sn-glycerol-3-phosphate acyltransferase